MLGGRALFALAAAFRSSGVSVAAPRVAAGCCDALATVVPAEVVSQLVRVIGASAAMAAKRMARVVKVISA
jgi:hypothetical protein